MFFANKYLLEALEKQNLCKQFYVVFLQTDVMKKRTKYAILIILLLVGGCTTYYSHTIKYAAKQGYGQLRIVWNSENISDIIKNRRLPDSIISRLLLMQEIRKFAIDSLTLYDSENYTTFYNQHGKAISWVVMACPKYSLELYHWKFPILGGIPYLGFFDSTEAQTEANKLKEMGYQTEIFNPKAWSTLGILKDPILSQMLDGTEGEAAALIFHELTHATIYVADNSKLNENLATFIGIEGANYYLRAKYGPIAAQTIEYKNTRELRYQRNKYFLQCADSLELLYKSFSTQLQDAEKERMQKAALYHFAVQAHEAKLISRLPSSDTIHDFLTNTYFATLRLYHNNIDSIKNIYTTQFNSDIKQFIKAQKAIYTKK